MSEKWKSLPRKYCEACKCWFGDNKASIAHHEGGKNHKDNMVKFLKAVRARSAKKNAEEALAKKFFSKVDEQALKSFQKDVESGIAKPLQHTPLSKREASQPSDTCAREKSSISKSKFRPSRKPTPTESKGEKKPGSSISIPSSKRIKPDPDARQPYGQWVPVEEKPDIGAQERNVTVIQQVIEPLEFTERTVDSSLIHSQAHTDLKVEFNKPVTFKAKKRNFRRIAED